MSQPPITSSQLSPDTGTSFPISPTTGNEFLLTADITGGSPVAPTHLAGMYVWDGTTWRSRPNSSSGTNWGWQDLIGHPVINTAAPGSSPDFDVFRDGLRAWAFDPASTEEVWIYFHLNHDYVQGSDLYPHVHWTHNDASPGSTSVRWEIEYSFAKGYEVEVFPTSTTITLDASVAAQYYHHITEGSDGLDGGSPPVSTIIDGTNIETDTVIMMRVARLGGDVDDTFASDAFMLYVDVHYQSKDTNTTTPRRNGPFTPFT